MNVLTIGLSIVFSLFSSVTLAYIMTATGLGPWIAPTIVLMVSGFYKLFRLDGGSDNKIAQNTNIIQLIGSVGGAIGMGIAWTFPVLYFLDAQLFQTWLEAPWYFAAVLSSFSLASGLLGSWLAGLFKDTLMHQEALPFPVSHMIHKTIYAQQATEQRSLFKGMGLTAIICFFRDGLKLGNFCNITTYLDQFSLHLSREYYLFPSLLGKEGVFAISPIMWAIGFIAGFGIALPLLVGLISKYLVLYPLYHHASYIPYTLFPTMSEEVFSSSFCCGLALTELILGLSGFPQFLYRKIKELFTSRGKALTSSIQKLFSFASAQKDAKTSLISVELIVALAASFACMSFFKFPILLQLFTITATVVMTYQICWMGGKLGIAAPGRFITFVMLPALFLFKIDSVQVTMLCTFIGICLMVAVNLLFGYKIGELSDLSAKKVQKYNWFGLVLASLAIGFCFWLLCTHFQLGSADFFAQRSLSRALLIQTFGFNGVVLLCGSLYSFILKPLGISPTMLLGGILMPNFISIALILGACGTFLVAKPKEYTSFWSGVFASETLWVLLRIII